MPKQKEASINKISELTSKEKKLGKALLGVNMILAQIKEANEIADWAKNINQLMPDVEPEQIQFVLNAVNIGLLEWDTFAGIQNIYKGIEETKFFYKAYKQEKDFKIRRANWIKENGIKAFYKLIFKRYNAYIIRMSMYDIDERIIYREKNKKNSIDPRMNRRYQSGGKGQFPKLYNSSLSTRLTIFKAIVFTYGHPEFNDIAKLSEVLRIDNPIQYGGHRYSETMIEYHNELLSIKIHDVDLENPKVTPAIDVYREAKRMKSAGVGYGGYKCDLFDLGIKKSPRENRPNRQMVF